MTNDAVRAVVITGKRTVRSSPREKRNNDVWVELEIALISVVFKIAVLLA